MSPPGRRFFRREVQIVSERFTHRSQAGAPIRRAVLPLAALIIAVPLLMSVGPSTSFTIVGKEYGVHGAQAGTGTGEITYSMTPGRLRMDAKGFRAADGMPSFSMIILFKAKSVETIVLEPLKKKYAESSETTQSYLRDPNSIESIFVQPSSRDGVCNDPSVTRCTKTGTGTLLGRKVETWKVTAKDPSGASIGGEVWYDPALHFVIQAKNDDGSGFVPTRIRIGKPAASVFVVPPGYTKY